MIRGLIAICGALALLITLGCGSKGPLYLPKPETSTAQDAGTLEPEEK